MKCEKIQELLLSDYPDGEVKGKRKNKVEEHLRTCPECREFEQTLREVAIEPFKRAINMKPRDSVWNRIREAVIFDKRQASEGIPDKLQHCLRRIFFRPRTVFTLATVIIAVFILTVMAIKLQPHNQKVATVQPKEEIEYLNDFIEEAEYFSVDENGGYNTAIEEDFL